LQRPRKGRRCTRATQTAPGGWRALRHRPARRRLPSLAPLRPSRDPPPGTPLARLRARRRARQGLCLRAGAHLRRGGLRDDSLDLQPLVALRPPPPSRGRDAQAAHAAASRRATLPPVRPPVRDHEPHAPLLQRQLSHGGVPASPELCSATHARPLREHPRWANGSVAWPVGGPGTKLTWGARHGSQPTGCSLSYLSVALCGEAGREHEGP